ncbi:hypothetical protein [Streptomyces sp. MUM 178J]|uniref:hypothetical protein n=1 Tax=Streptomyces sp. MUM 178J TaxID=2791991 RepID=UPI001F042056|nr:hypothetical protein [Streptomyces sp. MUM 178J]WRQ81359.1 hypothetical protein I3F59_019525 [Streptomyces sp. MUM 178J]
MSAEDQTSPEQSSPQSPRPARLTAAAAVSGVEGLALAGGGGYMLVEALLGQPDGRTQALMGGLTLIVLALIPLAAARGLLRMRSWSRGPAIITHLMALIPAWTLLRASGALIPLGIALAAVAVTGLVLLVNPTATQALGIRGAGATRDA